MTLPHQRIAAELSDGTAEAYDEILFAATRGADRRWKEALLAHLDAPAELHEGEGDVHRAGGRVAVEHERGRRRDPGSHEALAWESEDVRIYRLAAPAPDGR